MTGPDRLFIDRLLARQPDASRISLRWGTEGVLDQVRSAAIRDGFAGWLAQIGIRRGDRIAFVLPKGPVAALGILAAFRAGAVAIVLDAEAPAPRLDQMITDFAPRLVVTTPDLTTALSSRAEHWLSLASDAYSEMPLGAPRQPAVLHADSPALLLTTSGSTGRPKGVLLSHGNLSAFIDWATATFDLTAADRFVSLAPFHFDLSVLDLYASQMIGAEVYLASAAEARMPGSVARITAASRPTVLYAVPTQLQMLATLGFFAGSPGAGALRWVLSAGEVLTGKTARAVLGGEAAPRLANLYGPTETNVVACHMVDAMPESEHERLPIGRLCDHVKALPVSGAADETLVVDGPTVMLGYVTGPQDPPSEPSPRRYDTGDLVRRSADGLLHFCGRKDRQIKLRGFRIELEEIETVALAHPGVAAAVAVVINAAGPRPQLVLAVIRAHGSLEASDLLAVLKDALPRSAIPDRIAFRAELPQSSTGKTDRVALRDQIEGDHGAKKF